MEEVPVERTGVQVSEDSDVCGSELVVMHQPGERCGRTHCQLEARTGRCS